MLTEQIEKGKGKEVRLKRKKEDMNFKKERKIIEDGKGEKRKWKVDEDREGQWREDDEREGEWREDEKRDEEWREEGKVGAGRDGLITFSI